MTKEILNAIKRVHDEFGNICRENIKKMGVLSHQLLYFNEMSECSQNLVLEDLFNEMNKLGWNDWVEELKKGKSLVEKEVQGE